MLTTCARDYLTWANDLPPGEETVNRVKVRRFPVSRPRNTRDFGRRSLSSSTSRIRSPTNWPGSSEGPTSPALINHLRKVHADFDFFLFFSARYYQSWHGARAVPDKAVLVPTAERDSAIGLSIFGPLFRGARAIMYATRSKNAR